MSLRVLVADDQPLVRAGLQMILDAVPAMEIDPLKVIILTTFDMDEYVYEALRCGASGFLLKDVMPDRLIEAVEVVAAGDALLAPPVTRRLLDRFVQPDPEIEAPLGRERGREP